MDVIDQESQGNKKKLTVALRIFQFLILPVDLLLLTFAVTSLMNVYKFHITTSYQIKVSGMKSHSV